MSSATGHDIFVNSTSANFYDNVPHRRASHAGNTERQRETVGGGYHRFSECSESTDLHTVKRVLEVLNDGRMDVAGFLDALCWGNRLAVTDRVAKSARTNLMHSDRLATVFSRWLRPPRTSQGGSTAGGARQILLPVVVETVKDIINREMDAVVEELKEGSANVTEEGILETTIEEVQGIIEVTAPVFYDLVKTAAWSEKQEGRNTLRDPTKVTTYYWLGRDGSLE